MTLYGQRVRPAISVPPHAYNTSHVPLQAIANELQTRTLWWGCPPPHTHRQHVHRGMATVVSVVQYVWHVTVAPSVDWSWYMVGAPQINRCSRRTFCIHETAAGTFACVVGVVWGRQSNVWVGPTTGIRCHHKTTECMCISHIARPIVLRSVVCGVGLSVGCAGRRTAPHPKPRPPTIPWCGVVMGLSPPHRRQPMNTIARLRGHAPNTLVTRGIVGAT